MMCRKKEGLIRSTKKGMWGLETVKFLESKRKDSKVKVDRQLKPERE